MDCIAAIEGDPEGSVTGGIITSGSIELTYFPKRRFITQIGVRHVEVAREQSFYRRGAESPFVMRRTQIGDYAVVFESLLLAQRSARQEADRFALVVLESYHLDRVRERDYLRQYRIRFAVRHGRDEYVGGGQRRIARFLMDQRIVLINTNPVIGVIPTAIRS